MPTVEPDKRPDNSPVDVPDAAAADRPDAAAEHKASERQKEIGGRDGPDPTRYGDWEKAGRCIDF